MQIFLIKFITQILNKTISQKALDSIDLNSKASMNLKLTLRNTLRAYVLDTIAVYDYLSCKFEMLS